MPVTKKDLEISRLKQQIEAQNREIELMTMQRQLDAKEINRLQDEVVNLKNMLDAQIRQNQFLMEA